MTFNIFNAYYSHVESILDNESLVDTALLWYPTITRQLRLYTPDRAGCFAALSPRISVGRNIDDFERIDRGLNPYHCLGENRPKALDVYHRRKTLRQAFKDAHKVFAFADAILGDTTAICLDTIMLSPTPWPAWTPSRRHEAEEAVRNIAKQFDWTPRDTQAVIWTAIRGSAW